MSILSDLHFPSPDGRSPGSSTGPAAVSHLFLCLSFRGHWRGLVEQIAHYEQFVAVSRAFPLDWLASVAHWAQRGPEKTQLRSL